MMKSDAYPLAGGCRVATAIGNTSAGHSWPITFLIDYPGQQTSVLDSPSGLSPLSSTSVT